MSKYTTEVRFICEKYAGYDESVGYDKINEILAQTWDKVFDFDFPIFDENYRSVLCQKILKHYYTREIGFETVGLWKLKLDMMMNEIMPYYNQLYESTLLEFDPFGDANYTKDHKGADEGSGNEEGKHTGNITDEGRHGGNVKDVGTHLGTVDDTGRHGGTVTDEGTEHSTETSWDVYSDTPQGALTNVNNNTYLTNARKITDEVDRQTTNEREYDETNSNNREYNESTTNTRSYDEITENDKIFNDATNTKRTYANTNEYIDHVFGKFPGKSYSELLQEFRDTFLNIDVEIIGDLSDLFIKLW